MIMTWQVHCYQQQFKYLYYHTEARVCLAFGVEQYGDFCCYLILQVVLDNGYKATNSCAEAVAKLFPEKERADKVILDIGAGTGLLSEEVCISVCLIVCGSLSVDICLW